MTRTEKEQHKAIATIEKRWSSLALREGKDNLKQSKRFKTRGESVLAEAYEQEWRWDKFWADRRKRLAALHEKAAGVKK